MCQTRNTQIHRVNNEENSNNVTCSYRNNSEFVHTGNEEEEEHAVIVNESRFATLTMFSSETELASAFVCVARV